MSFCTSSVGKSVTEMMTSPHRARKSSGRPAKASAASSSMSEREGAKAPDNRCSAMKAYSQPVVQLVAAPVIA